MDSGMGEMSFHHVKLALSIALSSVKLNLLALYHLKFTLMCSIPIDISNNTRVLEIYDGIVNEKSGSGRRVKDIEIIIFDPRAIEIWSRMCPCVKGNGIFRIPSLANPYNVSVNSNLPEGDISCYLVLTVLVEKNKRVLPCITMVVLTPSNSWVIWVIELLSELGNIGDRTRCGGERDGGVVLSKFDRLVTLNVVIQHVAFNFLKDLGNEEEVFNSSVVTKGSGKDLVVKLSVP